MWSIPCTLKVTHTIISYTVTCTLVICSYTCTCTVTYSNYSYMYMYKMTYFLSTWSYTSPV